MIKKSKGKRIIQKLKEKEIEKSWYFYQ